MTSRLRSASWPRLLAPVVLFAAGALSALAVTGGVTRSAPPADPAVIRAVVERAIITDNTLIALPPGMKAGHLTDAERRAVRGRITSEYMKAFAGSALTSRMNGLLAWADRIATDPLQPRTLSFELVNLSMDPPIVVDDVATVTGTYQTVIKGAYDTLDGVTATYGGTYVHAFTYELERRGNNGTWFVTGSAEQPVSFEANPDFESNLDIDPAPDATKPPTEGNPPVPVNPANP